MESGTSEARSRIMDTLPAVIRYHCARGMSEMAKGTADLAVSDPRALALSWGRGQASVYKYEDFRLMAVTGGKATWWRSFR